LEKNGAQDIYVAPNAVEFISLLGANYTSYYDEKGFNWKKYAGAKVRYGAVFQGLNIYCYQKVLTIEGVPAWLYVGLIGYMNIHSYCFLLATLTESRPLTPATISITTFASTRCLPIIASLGAPGLNDLVTLAVPSSQTRTV
jgi:hypothetical protein